MRLNAAWIRLGVDEGHRDRALTRPIELAGPWCRARHLHDVEMQVRRRTVAGVATVADPLPSPDGLANINLDTRCCQVKVAPNSTVFRLDEHVVLVTERVVVIGPSGLDGDDTPGARSNCDRRPSELSR